MPQISLFFAKNPAREAYSWAIIHGSVVTPTTPNRSDPSKTNSYANVSTIRFHEMQPVAGRYKSFGEV